MATFKFVTMNNAKDPADLDPAKGECVMLMNVDPDNDGGVARRKATIDGLTFQPVTEFMGSRQYWAVRNIVYCSKALDDTTDERFNLVIALDDPITMIRKVDGGLFIGSTKELHYLNGTDIQSGGFDDVWSLPYGVVMGTGCHIKGELMPKLKMSGNCCIFASHRGVIVGGPGGGIVNLSQDKISYEYGYYGRAIVREENGLVHYVFDPDSGTPAYNLLNPLNIPSLD
jgi:hypothetical protein